MTTTGERKGAMSAQQDSLRAGCWRVRALCIASVMRNVYSSVFLRAIPLPGAWRLLHVHWNFDNALPTPAWFVATAQGFFNGSLSWFTIPRAQPSKWYAIISYKLRSFATLASFQYRHFRGHSSAMCTSRFNIRRNDFKEIQSRSNSLTCFKTFSRALGFFMLIYVHGVPPVHGRLIHINGFTSPLKELTYSAILIWFSTSLRSNSSVNCSTSQPSDHFRLVWLSLDSGWQQTSTISLLVSDLAAGPPVLGAAMLGGTMASVADAKAFCGVAFLMGVIARSFTASFHFSALTNGLVRMSAAWSMLGPWTSLYHLLLNCSSNQDRLTRWVLSVCRNVGDFPFSRILMVAWWSSTNTPFIDRGENMEIIHSPSFSRPTNS